MRRPHPLRVTQRPGPLPTGRGFTLLEVLVAMAILSVVLLAVYRLQAQSIAVTQTTRFHALAPLLARQKISEVEIGGLESLPEASGSFGDAYPGYAWRLSVTDTASARLGETAARLKKIDLTVSLNSDALQYRVRTYRFFER